MHIKEAWAGDNPNQYGAIFETHRGKYTCALHAILGLCFWTVKYLNIVLLIICLFTIITHFAAFFLNFNLGSKMFYSLYLECPQKG